jgi:hypothetical protein
MCPNFNRVIHMATGHEHSVTGGSSIEPNQRRTKWLARGDCPTFNRFNILDASPICPDFNRLLPMREDEQLSRIQPGKENLDRS